MKISIAIGTKIEYHSIAFPTIRAYNFSDILPARQVLEAEIKMRQHSNDIADRLISFFELSPTLPEVKRRVFIVAQIILIFALIAGTAILPIVSFDWFNLFANVLMLLFLTGMTWFLWRRREHQELIVFVIFLGAAAWVLLVMFYNILQMPLDVVAERLIQIVSPWFIWIILIYMICFLTFRAASAFRISLIISALFTVILIFCLARVGHLQSRVLYDVILLSVANALVIALAFPLAQAQEDSSQTDFLTGLKNRNRGYAVLVNEIERAQRYNETFAVVLFDIDYFKKINDSCGHPCGDAVLREVAAFANEHIRRTDLLCRWGGEEFLLLMTHADLASARLKADHMRQQIKNRPFHKAIHLTASFGVTAYYPYDSANSILERADEALYRAKRNGRNCVEVE